MSKTNIWGQMSNLFNSVFSTVTNTVSSNLNEIQNDTKSTSVVQNDTDASVSPTYPMEAGQIRKGGYIVIKGKPCKVLEVSTSKTGKHGHAKCNFKATNIFTGVDVPAIKRTEYTLNDISDEGFVPLMDEHSNTRDDIELPKYPDDLAKEIKKAFDSGEIGEIIVTVLSAMNNEQIVSFKKELN